jgi:hypothetical protein
MAKPGPVFKTLTKKPQRKTVPFFPSATKKKKKETALVPVPVKAKKKEAPEPVLNLKKASILDIQKAKIVKTAKSQKSHGTPTEKKEEMQKSVSISPALEKSSVAKSNQVEDMADAKKTVKKFDSKKFSDDILSNIKKVIPKNEEEMKKDQTSSEKMGAAQQGITDTLEKEKQNTNGDLASTVSATPDQSSVVAKVATPLPKEDIGAYPNVSNPGFAPPLKTAQDNDLSSDSKKIDDELANNNVSEKQLKNGNEPAFNHSLTEKAESQKKAAGTHQQYLKSANPIAGATKSSTNALTLGGLAKMNATRNKQLTQVDQNKQLKKQNEEAVRTKVANDLNKIYDDTKLLVETNLKNLNEKVNKDFDEALDIANKAFEKNVKERTETSWYEDLYNWAAGVPNEVKKVFIEEQDNFINSLAPVVKKIGDFVEKELTRATNDIEGGKLKTQEYWKNQSTDTQKIAGDVYTNATARFTELETKVDEANEGLKQSITTKFNAAVAKLEETFDKIQEENKSWLERAYDAVVGVIKAIIEMKNLLLNVLAKVADVVGKIILDPIGFLSNLLDAIVLGFKNFGKNALEHLKKGFFEWLMGNMPPSIKFPKQWDLAGIFQFVMSIFGLTWDNIKARATKMYGATVVAALETGFEIFQIIRKDGIGGLWNFIKEKIGDLKVMVVDAIQNMLIETVIKAGITWVISLFNPVGAFIKACKLIYDVISWFINNAKRILDLINSILDSTALIVAGKITQAATFVENSLAKLVPIAIGFLASLLGLGDLSKKVQALLDKIQAPINKAIDWVLEKAGSVVKTLFKAGKAGVKKLGEWLGLKSPFKINNEVHNVVIEEKNGKPILGVKSNFVNYKVFIETNKWKDGTKDKALNQATAIDKKLDNEKLIDDAKKKKWADELKELLNNLAKYIEENAIIADNGPSIITYEGTNSRGLGSGVDAKKLNSNNVQGSETIGAEKYMPNDYQIIKNHREANFVMGHLLNHNLGGKANNLNLSPITTKANKDHDNQVETHVIQEVKKGNTVNYSVKAIYSGQKNFTTKIEEDDENDLSDIEKINNLLADKELSPAHFHCISNVEVTKDGTKKPINFNIENTIPEVKNLKSTSISINLFSNTSYDNLFGSPVKENLEKVRKESPSKISGGAFSTKFGMPKGKMKEVLLKHNVSYSRVNFKFE